MVEQPHPSKTAQMLLGKRNFMVIGRTKAGYFHSVPHSTLLVFNISNSVSKAEAIYIHYVASGLRVYEGTVESRFKKDFGSGQNLS